MDENKVLLKEALKSKSGRLILNECSDFMISMCGNSNTNADWIKGMGFLINHLKGIDKEQ